MKKTIFLTLLSFGSFCAVSRANTAPVKDLQEPKNLQIGVKVGAVSSGLQGLSDSYAAKWAFGFQGGVFGRLVLPFTFIYVQPELLYTNSGVAYKISGVDHELRYNKIDIPVMVGVTIAEKFRVQAGPVVNWLFTARDNNYNVDKSYEPLRVGYQVGVGIDLSKISIDLKYEGGFSDFGTRIADKAKDIAKDAAKKLDDSMHTDVKHKEHLLILSVGVNLL